MVLYKKGFETILCYIEKKTYKIWMEKMEVLG